MKFQRLKVKKALITSAFFMASLFCLSIQAKTSTLPQNSSTCPDFIATETATVRYIHDGDTLFLTDNRKLRLIGIDTPELARKKKNKIFPEQAYALEARDFARGLIQQYGNQVALMPGVEKTDHYERALFHIQLSDGSLLQSRLLEAGLAVAYTTPPNQQLSSCYQKAERIAQQQNKRIWTHRKYQSISVEKLDPKATGFHIIKGKVRHIGTSKKAIWINFYGNFTARIDKRDLKYFHFSLHDLLEKEILVRGWIRHYKNKAQMSLRHPSSFHYVKL